MNRPKSVKLFILPGRLMGALAVVVLSGGVALSSGQVALEVVGPPIDAEQTGQAFLYRPPSAGPDQDGMLTQRWSLLGREDRAAASGSVEYAPAKCEESQSGPAGWEEITDAIAARAADHRVVIINESHTVTRSRELTRRLLSKLRPLGFDVFAAEAFMNVPEGDPPVVQHADLAWPSQDEGYYTREPAFGRLVREAKALHYRLVAYEQTNPSASERADMNERIAIREAEQARHLAAILHTLQPEERLLIHVGYAHARETPSVSNGREIEWMAKRLKDRTGIDPLTVDQTVCRHEGGTLFLAEPPQDVPVGTFDMIVSHPLETFVDGRPQWRRQSGNIPTAIPASLRPTDAPLVIEAFASGEPFDAVPVDRVFVEPGEDVPLLLPAGRYQVRAVRPAEH